jgi:hypothetical protein
MVMRHQAKSTASDITDEEVAAISAALAKHRHK